MTAPSVNEIYEQLIKPLSPADKLRLVELIAREMAATSDLPNKRSLLELEGLGAEIWQDVDPQTYVDQLRKERDRRQ